MKAIDVRKKSDTELTKLMGELESELREFRFGMSGGRTKNVRLARKIRADIARIKGVMTERAK
ncbi:MAG: 50S ribosomal protein L29 [Patescibacteria group bacterium]